MPIRLKVVDHAHLLNEQLAEHIKDRTEKFSHFFDGVKESRVTVDRPGPDVDKGRYRGRSASSPISVNVVDPAHLLNEQLAEHIKDRTEKFSHFFDGVKECRVTVDPPGPDVDKGRFRVRITLSVPNSQIAINRQTGADLP